MKSTLKANVRKWLARVGIALGLVVCVAAVLDATFSVGPWWHHAGASTGLLAPMGLLARAKKASARHAAPIMEGGGDLASAFDLWVWSRDDGEGFWDALEEHWVASPWTATPYVGVRAANSDRDPPEGTPAGFEAGVEGLAWMRLRRAVEA